MQTRGTTTISSEWGYHEDTQEYLVLTTAHVAQLWYHGASCCEWIIYRHDGFADPFGSHEASGRATTKETAVEAVEALLEIM